MSNRGRTRQGMLLCGAAAMALVTAGMAQAAEAQFDIPSQPLSTALAQFGVQAQQGVFADAALTSRKMTNGVTGSKDAEVALNELLRGTGLSWRREGQAFVIVQGGSGDPQSGRAAGGASTVEALIVTAQKREEDIQDVPIAISAFSSEQLDAQKIEGGFDLLKAIPNVTFTKTNFTSYNFQIRGVGTQSISATSDPGVAVAFNNSGILQNRLFEQEYLDIERVEVLRGPQGTLYGRNATAGVINVISAKPRMGQYLAEIKGEIGNYNATRLRGMLNIPIGDTFAIRGAYAGTDREGYTFNAGTGTRVDGRDLWTGRLSLAWQPNERLRADFIYERFEEKDDRLRTGKQLCHRDDGPESVAGVELSAPGTFGWTDEENDLIWTAAFGQGCKPGSLYSDGAFGTPNGMSYNFVLGLVAAKGGLAFTNTIVGYDPNTGLQPTLIESKDPYGGKMQSRDLREIESIRNPIYRAEADLFELNIEFDITDNLLFASQTLYNEDETFSFQDFNRFNTESGIFTDTSKLKAAAAFQGFPSAYADAAPGGVFCDPQLGCSDTIAGFDIAQASAKQFSQEFRLQSAFSGPLNFSVGANYTEFETLIDYYVMFNLITAMASIGPFNAPVGGFQASFSGHPSTTEPWNPSICPWSDYWRGALESSGVPNNGPVPTDHPDSACPFIDPNPVDFSRNFGTGGNGEGEGHNYFRSKNPYELKSWAAFGELYWNIQDDLKLTVGLRYTDDEKTFTVVPSQVLTAPSYLAGGTVAKGYPETGKIEQQWGEWSGRLVLDWQPVLDFTDQTLIYGSFSRGYKGGGANPPTPGFATEAQIREIAIAQGTPESLIDALQAQSDGRFLPILKLTAQEYGPTFEPEFVNAYELGTKNTLFGGGLTLNATAFYYDYTDYQVSQIRDRTAVNENFDAEMWGLELETVFVPSPNWRFLANIGYLDTKIAEGETSIDIMNRTQGDPNYTLVKPWAQLPSNCVVPTDVAGATLGSGGFLSFPFNYVTFCGVGGLVGVFFEPAPDDPNIPGTRDYDVNNYPELNGGAGLLADLSGNALPNAPHWTANVGGQYTFHLPNAWDLVVRGDVYWQSQSYHRIYNSEPYDKLRGWYNANLVVWAENPELDLTVEFYVKNLLNNDPITGAFLNSDDTGLTTNVFMLDPRLYGLSIRKRF